MGDNEPTALLIKQYASFLALPFPNFPMRIAVMRSEKVALETRVSTWFGKSLICLARAKPSWANADDVELAISELINKDASIVFRAI